MFIGEFKRTVDKKGKLLLPKAFAASLATGLVVTRGFERNLMIFSRDRWQLLADAVLEQSIFSGDSRVLRRRLFSNAAELVPDRSGRIAIPDSLCEFADIDDQAVLSGMYDYLEVWNNERWERINEHT
ncbi:MAG: hypothetical protein R3293_16580 [Candidatus Promineifilaceae bacterium]|nr:hypothetical protein [Candidatus Promineifilaceae bacterium]